ncbi:MAG: hypothetical protein M0C28_20850 [Candidatus Moduliflexus flocculans]|nr:hypothetical protein [Candidatus Moduliflexus flocculans]
MVAVHGGEAVLAVVSVLTWHAYAVHLRPGVFPMSRVWLDGRITGAELRRDPPARIPARRRGEAGLARGDSRARKEYDENGISPAARCMTYGSSGRARTSIRRMPSSSGKPSRETWTPSRPWSGCTSRGFTPSAGA